ncbi:hypothetical protein RRG08_056495 [Elysia crispata]|uniref:Chitin-binding type-2 domain-containing protein n=1 Tax=Elysia crispata TaxID=231223 RepID=A0AAE0XNV2_9GAST|nr:hypothetical protein RRG08_056495 [Elysia crispata]
MNSLYIVLAILPATVLCMNCTGQPDGNYEIGCRSYTICACGKQNIVSCESGMAYNTDTGKCDDMNNIPLPCGVMKDCSALDNNRHADTDNNCRSYYTCNGGIFVGHNFCPANLVFNEENQACDYPDNVRAPCGTKV